MPLSKRYTTISKAYSIGKKLGDKAAGHLAGSAVTKKFRNIVPTLSRTG